MERTVRSLRMINKSLLFVLTVGRSLTELLRPRSVQIGSGAAGEARGPRVTWGEVNCDGHGSVTFRIAWSP